MRSLILVLLMVIAKFLPAQTLEDYLLMADENNPGIRAAQTEYEVALQKLPQVKALPDPTVDLSFFLGHMILPEGNQIGSISAMQMFPWPGTLKARVNEASDMAAVKEQSVAVSRNELVFKIRNTWYRLIELEEKIQIQKELLQLLETDKELAVVKFQQGQAPMVDAIRADIMIDEVKTEIALLEQKRRPLEVAFNRLLARDAELPVNLSGQLPAPETGRPVPNDSLIAGNPALAVFDKQMRAEQSAEIAAGFMRKPMIGVGVQYMVLTKRKGEHDHIEPNTGMDMIMPMVSVTVPVWRKSYAAAAEERRLMRHMYSDRKEDMRNELAAGYEMASYEAEKSAQIIELLNRQMVKTRQVLDLMMAAYSNVGQDFEEILRMQQQLFRYRMEIVSAKTEYQLTRIMMAYLRGE